MKTPYDRFAEDKSSPPFVAARPPVVIKRTTPKISSSSGTTTTIQVEEGFKQQQQQQPLPVKSSWRPAVLDIRPSIHRTRKYDADEAWRHTRLLIMTVAAILITIIACVLVVSVAKLTALARCQFTISTIDASNLRSYGCASFRRLYFNKIATVSGCHDASLVCVFADSNETMLVYVPRSQCASAECMCDDSTQWLKLQRNASIAYYQTKDAIGLVVLLLYGNDNTASHLFPTTCKLKRN